MQIKPTSIELKRKHIFTDLYRECLQKNKAKTRFIFPIEMTFDET